MSNKYSTRTDDPSENENLLASRPSDHSTQTPGTNSLTNTARSSPQQANKQNLFNGVDYNKAPQDRGSMFIGADELDDENSHENIYNTTPSAGSQDPGTINSPIGRGIDELNFEGQNNNSSSSQNSAHGEDTINSDNFANSDNCANSHSEEEEEERAGLKDYEQKKGTNIKNPGGQYRLEKDEYRRPVKNRNNRGPGSLPKDSENPKNCVDRLLCCLPPPIAKRASKIVNCCKRVCKPCCGDGSSKNNKNGFDPETGHHFNPNKIPPTFLGLTKCLPVQTRFGNVFVLKGGYFVGPHYLFSLVLEGIITFLALFFKFIIDDMHLPWYHYFIISFCWIATTLAFGKCIITDPGVLPECEGNIPKKTRTVTDICCPAMDSDDDEYYIEEPMEDVVTGQTRMRRKRFCKICNVVQKKGVIHCESCDTCISGYDHHCPWTSKCIGGGNLSEFYTFVSVGMLSFLYIIATTACVPLFREARAEPNR